MKSHRLWILSLTALFLSACPSMTKPPVVKPPVRPGELDGPIDVADACPSWRWLGILPASGREPGHGSDPKSRQEKPAAADLRGTGCPPIAGWTESELFDPTKTGSLSRFCLYEHPGAGNHVDVPQLVKDELLIRADRDCIAVATAGNELEARTWEYFRDQFRVHAGKPATPLAPGSGVRLAILDTQRTRRSNDDNAPAPPYNSSHGFSLAHMARDLICQDGGSCAADVVTRLALPVVRPLPLSAAFHERDEESGGFVGTLGDLARAIEHEVSASDGRPLVLNLSLGWDGFHPIGGMGYPDERCAASKLHESLMPVPALAVLCSLYEASCRGALTVAAAGNRTGGPAPVVAPLLPAAWEARRFPMLAECKDLLGDSSLSPLEEARIPKSGSLVYAAGGVQAGGAPLTNSRFRAEPRLVAYGDHAVVEAPNMQRPTATYTGTSVATTVIASTAAAVWSLDPGQRSDEVVRKLWGKGTPICEGSDGTGCRRADFPERTKDVLRIRLCDVLDVPCWQQQVQPPDLDDFEPICSARDCTVDVTELEEVRKLLPPCSADEIHYRRYLEPRKPCPFDQFYSSKAHPWTTPQPQQTPCPNCISNSGSPYELYIEIRNDWREEDVITYAVLDVDGTSYALDLPYPLLPGQSAIVKGIPEDAVDPAEGTPMTLWFRIDWQDKTMSQYEILSVDNPVFVVE